MIIKSNEKKEKSVIELVIEVEKADFEKAVSAAYLKKRGQIQIPGFRKGKAPRNLIERYYGESIFWEDAVNDSYPEAYEAALKETGIEPVAKADMEIVEINKDGYSFKAFVPVMPEVILDEYKGLNAVKSVLPVEDSDIDIELDRLRTRNARVETVERPVEKGDTAVIDYAGSVDGELFEGGSAEAFNLEIGSGNFIPGFEDQIIGHSAGENFDINVKFPDEYHAENLAGKDAVFAIKLHEVKQSIKPELDDEFAKDVSEFDTLEELKADTRAKLTASREEAAQNAFESAVLEQLAEQVNADLPVAMVRQTAESMVDNMAYNLQAQGIDMDTYMKIFGTDAEGLVSNYMPQAEVQVKIQLGLDIVAKAEELAVTDEEVEAEYERIAGMYNMEAKKVKLVMQEEDIRKDLLRKKATDLVVAAAVAIDPPAKEEAAEEAVQETAETAEESSAE